MHWDARDETVVGSRVGVQWVAIAHAPLYTSVCSHAFRYAVTARRYMLAVRMCVRAWYTHNLLYFGRL